MVSIGCEQLKFDEMDNPIFVKVIDKSGNTVTLTPEQKLLKKSIEFQILFKRTALNTRTLQNIEGWFVQKIEVSIPHEKAYRYYYLYYERGMNLPCVRILDIGMGRLCGFTHQVTLSDKTFVKKVGAPKRISEIVAKKMKDDGSVLGIFNEENLAEVHVQAKSE